MNVGFASRSASHSNLVRAVTPKHLTMKQPAFCSRSRSYVSPAPAAPYTACGPRPQSHADASPTTSRKPSYTVRVSLASSPRAIGGHGAGANGMAGHGAGGAKSMGGRGAGAKGVPINATDVAAPTSSVRSDSPRDHNVFEFPLPSLVNLTSEFLMETFSKFGEVVHVKVRLRCRCYVYYS